VDWGPPPATRSIDEARYYDGDVAAPLHYLPALDVASESGLALGPGARILDFGYGGIGQLRMLASLGFDVTGVDVKPALLALYSAPGDTGVVPAAAGGNQAGRLRVLDGFFPTDGKLVAAIGGDYDLFVSKNTLKKGYIHPDRPAPDAKLVHLGVDDVTFLRAVAALLRPGGSVLLYNVFVPTPEGEPFQPMSDGRCPFPREAWEAAGFHLVALDVDDGAAMRAVIAATEHTDDGDDPSVAGQIHALYTFAVRP
jgi:SAM-dependent methyltransferase